MAINERFMMYAAAFEEAFASDEWSTVGTFFTEDAVYQTVGPPPFGQRAEGRAAVLAHFKTSLDGFDRLFDSREVTVVGAPVVSGDTLRFQWLETLRARGLPELRLEGEEVARFEGERIKHLEDRFSPETAAQVQSYFGTHAAALTTRPR
jgi:hypothetical protein